MQLRNILELSSSDVGIIITDAVAQWEGVEDALEDPEDDTPKEALAAAEKQPIISNLPLGYQEFLQYCTFDHR